MNTTQRKSPDITDGFVQEVLPLIKNGFVIIRSILDTLIERMEEAERNRQTDIRKETYESIIQALEAEIESVRKKEDGAAIGATKMEVLGAVISVLEREMEEPASRKQGKAKRSQKVKID